MCRAGDAYFTVGLCEIGLLDDETVLESHGAEIDFCIAQAFGEDYSLA